MKNKFITTLNFEEQFIITFKRSSLYTKYTLTDISTLKRFRFEEHCSFYCKAITNTNKILEKFNKVKIKFPCENE